MIQTNKMWNTNDGVRGVYPSASNLLPNQFLKLQSVTNRAMGGHMEDRILDSDLLGKCRVFWCNLSNEIEAFNLNLFTTIYGDNLSGVGRNSVGW